MSEELTVNSYIDNVFVRGLDEHYNELKTRTKCIIVEVLAMAFLCIFASCQPFYAVVATFVISAIAVIANLAIFSVVSKEEARYQQCKELFTTKYQIMDRSKLNIQNLDDFIKDADELYISLNRFARITKVLSIINLATLVLSVVIIIAALSI